MKNISEILEHYRRVSIIQSVNRILSWDLETQIPKGSVASRSEQMQELGSLIHREKTDVKFIDSVFSVDESALNDVDRVHLVTLKKELGIELSFDSAFVKKLKAAEIETVETWKKARVEANFDLVRDKLKNLVDLKREWARRVKESPKLDGRYSKSTLYEVMLDQYEPELTVAELDRVFEPMIEETTSSYERALELSLDRSARTKAALKSGHYTLDKEKQKSLHRKVLETMGLDFNRARVDESVHPFCDGHSDDIRLTTRFKENDLVVGLFSIIHEGGHALYEQGLPTSERHRPAGGSVGLGVHESQSRLHEHFIGRSEVFINFLAEESGVMVDRLRDYLLRVERHPIRVEADEFSYNLHIYLRYQMEKALVDGQLEVDEIPERWRELANNILGLKLENDRDGCLQDIHWFQGAFGYFPTYSIGNIIAAGLFSRFENENPSWTTHFAEKRDLSSLREFLQERVYRIGSLKSGARFYHHALGEEQLNGEAFSKHLAKRYLSQ